MFRNILTASTLAYASAEVTGVRTIERRLDSLDIVNDFLADLTFEIEVGTSFAGISVEDVDCDSFSLDALVVTSTVTTSSTPELLALEISGTGLDFSCDVLVDYGFFGTQTINIPSDGSEFHVPLNFYSDEFGTIIPTFVEVDPSRECLGDIIEFNLDLGILGVVDVEGIIGDELCPTLETALADLATTINDLGLDEIAGTRPTQIASVVAEMSSAEAAVEAILPEGFTLYDETAFNSFVDDFIAEIVSSPLAVDAIALAGDVADAYNDGDIDAAIGFVEDLVLLILETEVDISEDFVDSLISNGVIDILTSGDIDLVDLTVALVEVAGIALPTEAEITALFDSVPDSLRELLAPLEEFILSVVSASSGRRLQTITDLIDFDALFANGVDTSFEDVVASINFPILIFFYADEFATAIQLYNAYLSGDYEAVATAVQELLLGFAGLELEVPVDTVITIIDSGIIEGIIAGETSLGEAVEALLALFDLELPSSEEVTSIFDLLPEELSAVEEFILSLIAEGRRLQSLDDVLGLTIGDLADLISSETIDIDALVDYFGADTAILDVLSEVGDLLIALTEDLTSVFASGFSIDDTLPDSFLTVLELGSIILPDVVGELYTTVTDNGGTLAGFADSFTFEFVLDGFGTITAGVSSLFLSLDFAIDATDAGFAETSSIILPAIDVSSATIVVGLDFGGFATDSVEVSLDLSLFTQEGLTLGFDFDKLGSLDASGVTSLTTAADAIVAYASCAVSGFGASLSAQRTVADVDGEFESLDGGFEGLFIDAIGIFADMYLPALPTVLESTVAAFVDELSFFTVEGTCA